MKKFVLVWVLLISTFAHAADVFEGSQPRSFNLADQLPAGATIGGYPIWQGEQKWRLLDISTRRSGGSAISVPMGLVRLFQTEGKKLVAVMTVSANLSQSDGVDWTDEPCKRDDMLFKASTGGKFTNINCATINHITSFASNPVGKEAELFALFKEQGVEVPSTMIQMAFTRYSNNTRRLVVFLYVNPEVVGFPQDSEPNWGRSPWHRTQSFSDPGRKRFIDDLSGWVRVFQKQMDKAFDKKQDAFLSIPSWRSSVTALPVSAQSKPKVTLD